MHPDAITRLRAVNPAAVDPGLGREPVAQASLQRILDSPPETAPPAARRPLTSRGLVLVLAVLVLGVGGALAATDPMGWWSSNPSEAHYRVNPDTRAPTPVAQQIRCTSAGGRGQFRCTPHQERCYQVGQRMPYCKVSGTGLPYQKIDAISAPPSNSVFSRTGFTKAIAKALAASRTTAAQAARLRADLARVPDGFFTELRLASQYGTYGSGDETKNGRTRVPPVGQPATLVCTAAGRGLSCQDLNGDADAPVGAGVYSAVPGPDWRTVRSPRYIGGLPPGVHFTPAEEQVLIDLLRFGTTTSGSSSHGRRVKPVRIIHLKR
jgi:hypothetical protein